MLLAKSHERLVLDLVGLQIGVSDTTMLATRDNWTRTRRIGIRIAEFLEKGMGEQRTD